MGSITTYSHLLYNAREGWIAHGSKIDVVRGLCDIRIDREAESRRITAVLRKFSSEPIYRQSYGDEYTDEEMMQDAAQCIISRLVTHYGFEHYRQIGF